MVEDVAAAFAWTKAHAAEHGADPARIFLAGHSSGAQLALLLASDARWLAAHELSPADIAGVVGLSTPVDLAPRKGGIGFGDALLGGHGADVFGRDVEVMRSASPIAHLSRNLPPTLLAVGENDFPLLADDARAYAARALDLGLEVPVIVGAGKSHMAVVAALLDDEDPIARATFEFFDAHSTPPPPAAAPGH